jgi:hypothetical protein
MNLPGFYIERTWQNYLLVYGVAAGTGLLGWAFVFLWLGIGG